MAEAAKLTETVIKNARLEPGRKQDILWDMKVTGLGVRVLPGGSKTFWFQYRPIGGGRSVSTRMIRIGTWPEVSLDAARTAANGHAGAVAKGKDPAADKQEKRRRARATLRQLLTEKGEYERHLERRHIVNIKTIMSGLRRGLAGLMARDVAELDQGDIVAAITAIEDRGKPGAAQDLRKFAHTFWGWCVKHKFAKANIMAGLKREKQTRAEKVAARARKARALSDAEIIAVWKAAENESYGAFGRQVRLGLLAGTRRSEPAKLLRERILSDRFVRPPLSTKSGEQHEVPLTPLMRTIIAEQPVSTSRFAFPSEKTGGAISGWTKAVAALQKDSGVDVTLHDLRRTCRTLMSRLGVAEDIAELAIGHKRTGLGRLYNFDEAWQLRCDALAKVSDHIAALLSRATREGNVVAIPTRT